MDLARMVDARNCVDHAKKKKEEVASRGGGGERRRNIINNNNNVILLLPVMKLRNPTTRVSTVQCCSTV